MPKQPPNILFILSDQHTPGITGCYGDDLVQTPNLDRLAAEGTVFDSFYCNSPLCVPSRMSLMTGRYPWRIDVLNNGLALDSRVPTFAHMIAGAGYRTCLAGRMHFLGDDQHHGFQERLGGDYAPYAYFNGEPPNAHQPLPGSPANSVTPAPLSVVGAGSTSVLDLDRLANAAARDWLTDYCARDGTNPFLLTVGYFAPHCPYIVPGEYYHRYRDRVLVEPVNAEQYRNLHPIHQAYIDRCGARTVPPENLLAAKAAYYGLVNFLDDLVGELLDTLEHHHLLDNTVIVYASDHGDMLGEHGRWHKDCFYEQSARVPFIVRPPAGGPARRIVQCASLVDLFPTLVAMAGIEHDLPINGHSMLPLLAGNTTDWSNTVCCEDYLADTCNRMIREDNLKLSVYSEYEQPELYDLAADPGETVNQADNPAYAAAREHLERAIRADGWSFDVFADTTARMNRLGYHQLRTHYGKSVRFIVDGLLNEVPGFDRRMLEFANYLE